MIKKIILSALLAFLILFAPATSYAQLLPGVCRGRTQLDTAIGCITITEGGLTAFILRWALSIGGGVAFLLIVYAGFLIITSAGNPQRLQAGKELLTAALSGLLLLVFSAFILRVIGVDILRILPR